MSLDVTTADAIMKKTYPDGVVDVDYTNSKTLALLKKNKGSLEKSPFGNAFVVPVKHGNPQAGGAGYAAAWAQASAEQSRYKAWSITPGTVFHFADVNGDIVRRGEGAGSFVDAMTSEIENAKKAMTRILEIMFFKGGWGDLCVLHASANVASATGLQLQYPWMVRMIETGMSLVASASEAGHVLKSATAIKVVGRHAAAGTIDMAAAPNTQSWAASDTVFRISDRENSATPTRLVPTGFKGWLPQSAPSSTAFFGVDRTVDDRLGGLRHNANTSGSPEEAFMDAEALVDAEGGRLTHFVMGRNTFNALAKSMSNHIEHAEEETEVGIGISGFRLKGSDALFYWDSACEEGVAYGFNIDEVEYNYAGDGLLYIDKTDGMTFRKVQGSDLWRTDMVTCGNLIMPAPGHAVVVYNLPTS